MKRMRAIEAAIAACFLLSAASPTERAQHFEIFGKSFQVMIPEKFCLPSPEIGKNGEKFLNNSSGRMALMFVRCETPMHDPLKDFTAIVSLTAYEKIDIPLEGLLKNLGPKFDVPLYRDFMAKEMNSTSDNSYGVGYPIKLNGDSINIGHDGVCLYVGGERPPHGEYPYTTRSASCLTSVSGKLISISRYDDPSEGKSFGALLREVRSLALSIKATKTSSR